MRGLNEVAREGARRNVRSDAPNKNYTIKHNTLIVNKRQTITSALLRLECSIDCISGTVTKKIFFRSFSDYVSLSTNFEKKLI